HDRNAGARQRLGGTTELAIVDRAEREGVANRDPSLEPGGARARCNLAQFKTAERPRVMQVNVDADPMAFSDGKDGVEVSGDVIVNPRGIESADEIGAVSNRLIEKVHHAWVSDHAALGKRDNLDSEKVLGPLPHLQ